MHILDFRDDGLLPSPFRGSPLALPTFARMLASKLYCLQA